jgi:hypothetical protein
MSKKPGQPKISEDIEVAIFIKVVQYVNRYNIAPMRAWEKITELKHFPEVIKKFHGKKRSVMTKDYIYRLQYDHQTHTNFYKKHISKWIKLRSSGIMQIANRDLFKKYPRIVKYLKK